MRFFYVDTENIKSYDFMEEWNLNKNDTVIFFISENSRTIKFKDLYKFIDNEATMIFEDVIVGEKNAMDFQMVACLASNLALYNNQTITHYIVSDDNGFYTAIKYLNNKYNHTDIFIIKPDIDKSILNLVNKVSGLNDLNNGIRKLCGQDVCMKVYPTYRDLFNKKQKAKEEEALKGENEYIEITTIYNNSSNLRDFRNALRSKFGNVVGNQKYLEYKEKHICEDNTLCTNITINVDDILYEDVSLDI